MRIRFWGTRGSIATPGPGTVRYGGNTSCVELRSDGGELVVIDGGTGARLLGRALVDASDGAPVRGSILLGHTHWDHIQGLPFFAPLFQPGARWDVYGPRGLGASLSAVLAGQMEYQYFPVSVEQLTAEVIYHDLVEGTFSIGDLAIRTRYLNHPALTLGYRIEEGGAVVCYLSDHEPFDPALGGSAEDRHHVELMAGADVVVHDAQYDAAEYAERVGWGHSPMEYVVDAALAAGVRTLVLYHHDPGHDDDAIDALLARARDRAGAELEVRAAAEGDVLDVRSDRPAAWPDGGAAASASPPALDQLAASVVVMVRDPAISAEVAAAATAEHLTVLDGPSLQAALADGQRAVVVVQLGEDGEDWPATVEHLRTLVDPGMWSRVAVLAVVRTLRRSADGAGGITDWLVWPASATHVRTKLRAAVLRQACRWLAAPTAPDEERRLAAVRRLGTLEGLCGPRLDRLTDAAAAALGVPIALITLVDAERQWFPSRHGLDALETHRDESVCAHAILEPDVLQVPDLLADPRFADSPAVAGPGRARFYAGAPLVLGDGSRVGTLCVIDHRPRLLDDDQLDELRRLARDVVHELEATAPAVEEDRPA